MLTDAGGSEPDPLHFRGHLSLRGLLLIDDEPAQTSLIGALVARTRWRVTRVADAAAAMEVIARDEQRIDAILIDIGASQADGVSAIAQLTSDRQGPPVVAITTSDSADLAVRAMRAGATDFIVKPVTPDRLCSALNHASDASRPGELRPLAEKLRQPLGFDEVVGEAPSFRAAIDIAMRVAQTSAPVLIEGESGVGKEVIAQAIHRASSLHDKPLITVNCGAIPSGLVESELFGHERGAFTGAFERRIGHFAAADGGTIFLDEIGELPLEAQVKLLRVLQSGEIQPIGARSARRLNVRVLAATNRSLAADVARGRFREDLFYRLAVVQIVVPPLRQRIEDVGPLARHLLTRISGHLGVPPIAIDAEALQLLSAFHWPGNVRQLHNVLFRAAIFCPAGTLSVADLPHLATMAAPAQAEAEPSGHPSPTPQNSMPLLQANGHIRRMTDIEGDMIRFAISHYHGRMSEVARRLGIGRSTLYRKLGELGIDQNL